MLHTMPLLLVQYIYPPDRHDYKNSYNNSNIFNQGNQLGARGPGVSRKSRKIFGPEGSQNLLNSSTVPIAQKPVNFAS